MKCPGIIGSEPTTRVKNLKKSFFAMDPYMCCDRAVIYTEVYKKHENLPMVVKRAMALRETLSRMPIFIVPGEVIMGHPAGKFRAAEVFPDVNLAFMKDIDTFWTREHNRLRVTPEVKAALFAIEDYWKGKTVTDLFAGLRPDAGKAGVAAGLLSFSHEWSGLAHVAMDYRKILDQGIDGIRRDIEAEQAKLSVTDPEYPYKAAFYRAGLEVCEGARIYAERHRRLALELAAEEADPVRKAELAGMADLLARVPMQPATTFREAMQSLWFLQIIPQIECNGYSITPGRFDQYMWPFLKRDLEAGIIDLDQAQELVDMLFLKFGEIMRVDSLSVAEINAGYASGQNVAVGGVDIYGNDATNPLSYICLKANYHVGMHQPNFTVRLHKGTPPEFLDQVVESISCGNGMPQILNDELIIRSLREKGMNLSDARDYIPVGCDEITVHGHWARCNGGYVNFAKALELTLGEGRDLYRGVEAGLPLSLKDCGSFDALLGSFDRQLLHAIDLQLCDANLADHIHQKILPVPFVSLFMDDCIKKGRDVTDGGARYNTTGPVGVGTATAADSLLAIKTLVYEQGKLTLAEYRDMLRRNFQGDEPTRQYILNRIAKFGNDIDTVDDLAVHVTKVFFDELDRHRNYRGGDFWAALYSVSAQIALGNATAATPDGRLAGLPLSDGLTPMYGMDTHGPTAALKSEAKIEQWRAPNGVIINQRFTQKLFQSPDGRKKLAQLFRSFVDLGSFHWQFNLVDNATLRQAQAAPEEYRSLVVRVAGYSAIFVELSLKAQNSIIERYESDIA